MSTNHEDQSSENSFFNPWAIGAVTAACGVGAAFVFVPAAAATTAGVVVAAAVNNPEQLCEIYCSVVGDSHCVCGHHHN